MGDDYMTRSSSGISRNDLRMNIKGRAVNPVAFQRHIRNDTIMMNQLLEMDPDFAKFVQDDDIDGLQCFLEKRFRYTCHCRSVYRFHHLRDHLSGGSGDFIVEALKKMEDAFRKEGMDEHIALGLRSLGFERVVVGLYVDIEVKGYTWKAFVQSGAHSTMISKCSVDKCGLMWLVDLTYKGDDQSMILGVIHSLRIKIGGRSFPFSFLVVDSPNFDFILGADWLSKHECIVDLRDSFLRVEDGKAVVPLVQEKDVPEIFLDKEWLSIQEFTTIPKQP